MTTNSISANELFIDWTNREEHSRGGAKSISNYESVVNEVSLPANNELPKSSVLLFAQKHMHTPQCPLDVPVESACSIKQSSTIDAGTFGKH